MAWSRNTHAPHRARRVGAFAPVLVAVGLVAAACGGDNSSKTASSTAASGASATSAPAASSAAPSGGASTSASSANANVDCTDFIKKTFASDGGDLGGGRTIKAGAGLLLGTSQAYYGQQSQKGIDLAVKQIKEAGGPDFQFDVKDLTITPTAGADVARSWGGSGIHLALAAGFFGTGSMIPVIAQDKILTFDPGGGTSTTFQGKDFAWGARAITPDDALPGVTEWLKKNKPDAKRWAIAGYDIGDLTKGSTKALEGLAASNGAQVVGQALFALPGQGTPDYPSIMGKLRGMNPDVIFLWTWGSDPAAFMKQYATSGMHAMVVGPDFGSSTVGIAGKAFDGYNFAYDYFDASSPGNAWGQCFVQAFRQEYKEDPDYYPANYYEDTFFLWETVKRVLKAGGDINDGDALQKALVSNLTLASVYGAGSPTGTITLDPGTHSVAKRPMGLFEVKDGKPKAAAYFNIAGADYNPAS